MNEQHEKLLFQVAKGNHLAFQKLYSDFANKVYNTVLSHLQSREEAEEVTQDVFVEVFRSAAKFKSESSVSTWIYRIAVNKSIDRIRFNKRKKRFAFLSSIFGFQGELRIDRPDFEHPGVSLEKKEHSQFFFKALDKLSDNQKTAFVLTFIEGRPQAETAEIMLLKLKALESLLQRAKANLRKELEEFYNQQKD